MKPILFNTEEVRALLDGRKTVTRRVVKPQPNGTFDQHWGGFYQDNEWVLLKQPYRPGDILYVRETWAESSDWYEDNYPGYEYKADYPNSDGWGWRPSIHMPREAARIFLRVTDVRVERLQDVDGRGILAEGVDNGSSNPSMGKRFENMQRMAFENLWDSTIKPADRERYGWAANPWVWVIEFERCDKPEEG